MANPEHIEILKQGVDLWNQWRREHPYIWPDLSGADLNGANLIHANLSEVNLSEANLGEAKMGSANLSGANLREAKLWKVSFVATNLNRADLSRAKLKKADLDMTQLEYANLKEADLWDAYLWAINLRGANLKNANLQNVSLGSASLEGADLSEVNLKLAKLWGVNLDSANLSGAKVEYTVFGNVDLSRVKGLDAVIHNGPSTIGIDTIYSSGGNIPEIFLKGAGVDDTFITYIHSLIGKAIEYYSCFISYSSKDDTFARRLYADLQSNNVRCWFAPEDLKWGERIRTGIDEAIRLHDKLLLILSKQSVASGWVESEVKTALAREKKEKRTILFPVRLDRAVFDCPFDWATEIRHERNIGNFTQWKNHDAYEKAFARLLRDLKAAS